LRQPRQRSDSRLKNTDRSTVLFRRVQWASLVLALTIAPHLHASDIVKQIRSNLVLPPFHASGYAEIRVAPEFLGDPSFCACDPDFMKSFRADIDYYHTPREELLELTTSHGVALTYARRTSEDPHSAQLTKHWVRGSDCVGIPSSPPTTQTDPRHSPFRVGFALGRKDAEILTEKQIEAGTLVLARTRATTNTLGEQHAFTEQLRECLFDSERRCYQQRDLLRTTIQGIGEITEQLSELRVQRFSPQITSLPVEFDVTISAVPPSLKMQLQAPTEKSKQLAVSVGTRLWKPAVYYRVVYDKAEPLPPDFSLERLAEQRSRGMRLRTDQSLAQLKLPEEAAAKSPYRAPKSAVRSFLERWGLALGVACLAAAATTATILFVRRKE